MKNAVTPVGYVGHLDSFALALKVEGLKPHTISCYVRDVQRLGESVGWIPPARVKAKHVRLLSAQVAPKTVHETQLGLRRFFRFLVQEGEIVRDPTDEVKLIKFRVVPQPNYSVSEIRHMLAACDSSLTGVRDRAKLTVLFDTGVRVGELISMSIPDFESKQTNVDGKSGLRTVPLGDAALLTVRRYMSKWNVSDGALWPGRIGTLTPSGTFQAIERLCRRAGVPF